jgi:hypothetical protein
MSGERSRLLSKVLLCGSAAVYLAACGVDAATEPNPDRAPSVAAVATCTTAQAADPWAGQAFGTQTGSFGVDLTATPSEAGVDAVIGLSNGPASGFTNLAAIVRFNADGAIDVRAGSAYQADMSVLYTPGTSYRFHLDIDVFAHTYSVVLVNPDGSRSSLAQGYPFRTEQAQVASLNNLATKVDADSGAVSVCDVRVMPAVSSECSVANAGSGFVAKSIGMPGEVVVTMDFVGTPDSILDGVAGLSPRAATTFNDLAAAVRFSPDGAIDARNGGAYQADVALPYLPGQSSRIRIVADVPTRSFGVYVATGASSSIQLAHHYAFRSPSSASFLGDLDAIVDSEAGALSICNPRAGVSTGVRSSREGNYAVAPLPSDAAIISDGTTTLHVDSSGHTVAQVAAGGQVAVDPSGNVYLARITGSDLVVEAYTPALVFRWTASFPVDAQHRVLSLGADAASVLVAVGPSTGGVDLIKRWLADGTESITRTGPLGDVAAVGAGGSYAIGSAVNGNMVVTKWALGETQPIWQKTWQNPATINAIAVAPGGNVYFTGDFTGPTSFDGPTLTLRDNQTVNTYVAAIRTDAEPLFSTNIGSSHIVSIASNGTTTAVSGFSPSSSPRLLGLVIFNSQGERIIGDNGATGFTPSNTPGVVAVGPTGRVFWNFAEPWPLSNSPTYPFFISLQPGV